MQLASASVLIAGLLLSGCVGLMVEKTAEEEISSPLPVKAQGLLHPVPPRWACHTSWDAPPTATSSDYIEAWGEPGKKTPSSDGEIWTYESREWCGVWVFWIVPVPLLLPACRTFDHVHFEHGVAVRAESRRVVAAGFGIAAVPNEVTGLFPLPFGIAPGQPSDGQAETFRGVGGGPRACQAALKPPAPIPIDRSNEPQTEDL